MKRRALPKILVTGASGFIGRNLIEDLKEEYYIYALARQAQQEAGVRAHKNIEWILVDIAQKFNLANVIQNIKKEGGVDFIIHLAAYYNFNNAPHPEYERTNVQGTRFMLEYSKELGIKRFIFASSIAACKFPPPGKAVNERSPLDAEFSYAVSKKKCEEMLKEYSANFPCTVLRFAAVFSDWCEFGPLYMFLRTWLSSSYRSRIIGGHGESAIPYVHLNSVLRVISLVLEKSDRLPQFDIYVVSPEAPTSHLELYDLATRLYFEKPNPPIFISKWLAVIWVYAQDQLGRLIGKRPFVRPWMMKYIDMKLTAEASYTRKTLGWEPRPRFNIMRRLLFIIENLKSSPVKWHQKNAAALTKTSLERPKLIISEVMQNMQEYITNQILEHLLSPDRSDRFKHYHNLNDPDKVRWYIEVVYNLLISSVRNGDRYALVNYARSLAKVRSRQGFDAAEVCQALYAIGDLVSSALLALHETKGLETIIHDWITLTIQLAVDEVEDTYERIARFKNMEMDEEIMGIRV
jgi:nucleoside-diphosphate-sugar epimerase